MFLLRKYIIKELLLHFLGLLILLMLICSLNKFIGLLTKMAIGKLPFIMIWKMLIFYIPEILSLLIPVCLFIATLFTLSKIYAENKIIVLFSSKLGWYFLSSTILSIALIIAGINAILTLWVAPTCIKIREKMLMQSESLSMLHAVIPGNFNVSVDGKQVFYAGKLDSSQQLQDIFVAINNNEEPLRVNIITAKTGKLQSLEQQDGNLVTLQQGSRYAGLLGSLKFSIIDFGEYSKHLFPKPSSEMLHLHNVKPTKTIWRSKNSFERAEYIWRLFFPTSTIILAMLALGLAKVAPRQGRFAKFLPGILIYVFYCNVMLVMRKAIAEQELQEWTFWLAQGGFISLAGILWLNASGWLNYYRSKLGNLYS